MSSDGFCSCRSYAGGGGVVEGRVDGFEGGGRQISGGGVRVKPHQIVRAQACAADRAVKKRLADTRIGRNTLVQEGWLR